MVTLQLHCARSQQRWNDDGYFTHDNRTCALPATSSRKMSVGVALAMRLVMYGSTRPTPSCQTNTKEKTHHTTTSHCYPSRRGRAATEHKHYK